MKQTDKALDKNRPGQEQGLSFWQCFARNWLYSRDLPGLRPYLYIIPFFLAYLVLDFSLRFTYRGMGIVGVKYLPAGLFTLGWALVFAGLVFFLPKVPRWFVRCVPLVTFVVLAITHSGFMSAFRKFFSFSSLSFGGTGSFVDASYITINWKVIAGSAIAVLLMMISGRLLKVIPPKPVKGSVLAGVLACLVGAGLVAFTHIHYFPVVDRMIWETSPEENQRMAYHEFNDTTNALMVSGLYQYTVRDLGRLLFPQDTMTDGERQQIDDYVAEYEAAQKDNAYTGLLAGKNVIMVQLEAIDTWMLQEAYMPNLAKLKSEGLVFTNHYTPAYISAGGTGRRLRAIQHNGFDFLLQFVGQLISLSIKQLDAVVFTRIMRGGNHHTRIRLIMFHQISYRRCGHNAQQRDIRSHRAKASHQRRLQHIGGNAGILADHYPGTAMLRLQQHHRRGAADSHSDFAGQFRIGYPAGAVRTKQSSHTHTSFSKIFPQCFYSSSPATNRRDYLLSYNDAQHA